MSCSVITEPNCGSGVILGLGNKCEPRIAESLGLPYRKRLELSGGVRVRFRVWFQAVKVPIFDGFPVENPTNKATAPKLF